MKNKKVKIIVLVFIAIGLIFIGGALLLSLKKDDNEGNVVEKPSNKYKYDSLMELAKAMYDDSSYKKLPVDKSEGVYYMTLKEYKKNGYNMDFVDSACPDDLKVLNFSVDENDDFNPIYTLSSCKREDNINSPADSNTSLIEIANQLYESNEYLNFIKGDGGYYMTIGMYKSRGYDLSLINPSCPDDSGVLFFDVDNKDKYELNPVFAIYECN